MNSVFDKPVEVEVQELSEGIAIVIDGDTAPRAIARGQFLYIKNHSTLPTGGYNATAAIASGDTISSSNVIIDADGIANAIKGNIDALNSNLTTLSGKFVKINYAITPATGIAFSTDPFKGNGAVVVPQQAANFDITASNGKATGDTIGTFSDNTINGNLFAVNTANSVYPLKCYNGVISAIFNMPKSNSYYIVGALVKN